MFTDVFIILDLCICIHQKAITKTAGKIYLIIKNGFLYILPTIILKIFYLMGLVYLKTVIHWSYHENGAQRGGGP